MNLSDRQLERLLHAAAQAQGLDHAAHEPLARLRPSLRPTFRSPALLMAACLGLAAAAAWFLTPAASPPPHSAATRTAVPAPTKLTRVPTPTGQPGATRAVVLAIAEGPGGELTCVRWKDHCLTPGSRLADLAVGDLESIGTELACDASSPRLLIVGLEGPASSLPASDAEALSLAGCFRASAACGTGGFDEGGCSAAACALPSVSVRVASLVR